LNRVHTRLSHRVPRETAQAATRLIIEARDDIATESKVLLAGNREHSLDLFARLASQREGRLRLLIRGQVAIIQIRFALLFAALVVVCVVLKKRVRVLAPGLVLRASAILDWAAGVYGQLYEADAERSAAWVLMGVWLGRFIVTISVLDWLFRLGLVIRITDSRFFLLQIVCLLEQFKCDNLHYVNHAIVAPDLLDLVEVVENSVLCLVDLEKARVGHKERPH